MKNVILIILTMATLKVAGQNHLVGIKMGVSSTNITANNFPNQTRSRAGLSAGLSYEFLFKKHFSVGADLIYNQRGFIDDRVFKDDSGEPLGEIFGIKYNYDYISLPIKAGFNIGNKLYGFVNIGVIPSILIDANTVLPTFDTNGNVIGDKTYDVTNQVTKFDFAGLAEVGGGYKFNNRYWLFSSFSYQQSFTTISNSEYYSNSNIKHRGVTITIGLKYSLTKL